MVSRVIQRLRVMTVTGYATLRITLVVLYRVNFRGGYPREFGDRLLRWWAGKLVDSVRIRYVVHDPHGLELEPGKRYIIMSNHRSHYDIPLVILALPGSIRMLTKKELFKVPLWGRGLKAGEFISIDRSDIEQAKKDLAAARRKMESGVVLWIAPEGTRSRTGKLGPFKKGGSIMAIESGATIIPVGIQGTENVLRPKTLDFHLDQDVTINVGQPIEASRFTIEQKDLLLAEVRGAIAELCGEADDRGPEGLPG
ncbi:MAG: 1-acyl-sn-glycerol-3-phosphate acyltransferase [Actinobacteria bacterium]|nr:1-acyl-sn-glycerol-3-phosphate acyltransferase [Actinomycetota bacterium]MBU2687144.1 1-acyl-sn-glycerol-3-phosphate acyltransferase [Actinomycetota bacterium]